MPAIASSVFSFLVLAASIFLAVWGSLGLIEYLFGVGPIRLQNPVFPDGVQLLHWIGITATGLIYLIGYYRRWQLTPFAMVVAYSVLATLCFVETMDFLTNRGRYVAMVLEYAAYIVISIYLFRSERMQTHFGRLTY